MGEGEGPAEACSNYRETKRISLSSSSNGSRATGEMGEGENRRKGGLEFVRGLRPDCTVKRIAVD
jgi:hypothetical protein